MELVTENQAFRAHKQPPKSHPSNKIKVLLDSGPIETSFSFQKEKTNLFPTWLGRCRSLSICEMGASKQLQGEIREKFFDYSASREYFLQPDIVQYDTNVMIEPGFDLILGSNTMKELGFA